ncbi:MAG: DUF268 domain-containing protein [Oscillospiraceae bacterium]|nr:DUF268 domain-containing protein [Oscillospiraceae bacterium]
MNVKLNMIMENKEELTACEKSFLEKLHVSTVIIWGATQTCKQIIDIWGRDIKKLIIWDTNKAGQIFENREIKKPELIRYSDSVLHNTQDYFIILALNTQKSYWQCYYSLKELGYVNRVNGATLAGKAIAHRFKADYDEYSNKNTDELFKIDTELENIQLHDWYKDAGVNFNDDLLTQDLWAAKKVYKNRPSIHYDIASRVDGFITHLLSFGVRTVMIDIRNLDTFGIENLEFIRDDATMLKNLAGNSVESLSALCSIEHFGLGRFGDPIDPDAHIKCFKSIQRVMKKGGNLYLSLQVSNKCSLVFNAHRVYTAEYVIKQFDSMDLIEFSYTSKDGLISNANINSVGDGDYYGLFHFQMRE